MVNSLMNYSFTKSIYFLLAFIIKTIARINPEIIVFTSKPDYSDNARALSEYILRTTKKYKIYWRVNDAKRERKLHPDINVRFISDNGLKRFSNLFIYLRASYMFSTHSLSFYKGMKRDGQHLINLWHGCSYKDRVNKSLSGKDYFFEKHLVAGPLFVKTKSYYFRCPDESYILAKGYPRYDWLLQKDEKATTYYKKLKEECSHLIIWMPTFRNDKDGVYKDMAQFTQFPLVGGMSDWQRIDEIFRENNVKLIIKLHVKQAEYDVDWTLFSNIVKITNEDIEKAETNLYSFLACTDALISDYSSVAVDYMIVDKPIAFALDDYEQYKDARGFVVDNPLDYMPGHHLYSIDDLSSFVKDVSNKQDPYCVSRARLFDTLVYRSESYCKEIAESLGIK